MSRGIFTSNPIAFAPLGHGIKPWVLEDAIQTRQRFNLVTGTGVPGFIAKGN